MPRDSGRVQTLPPNSSPSEHTGPSVRFWGDVGNRRSCWERELGIPAGRCRGLHAVLCGQALGCSPYRSGPSFLVGWQGERAQKLLMAQPRQCTGSPVQTHPPHQSPQSCLCQGRGGQAAPGHVPKPCPALSPATSPPWGLN